MKIKEKSLLSVLKDIDRTGLDGIRNRKKRRKKTRKKPISKKVTIRHTRQFHKQKHKIQPIIRSTVGPKEIIYGENALKARFPGYLKRQTTDLDVYSPTPRRDARQAERKLDKSFGGDFFYVKKAEHPGTYKVKAYANQEGYADFTRKPQGGVPHDTIHGKKYAKLSVEKQHRRRSLRNIQYKYRHGKDRDALNRILIHEKNKRRKK
jgi:hypothetical protein